MNTRFDSDEWITGQGEYIPVSNMETTHIINTLKMIISKPLRVISMLIQDVDKSGIPINSVWTKSKRTELRKESIREITKMKPDECIEYTLTSPLGSAMLKELNTRGVDVENIITYMKKEEN